MMHEMANGNRNRCANMAIEEGGKTTMENISDVHLVQHHCDGHHDRPSPFSYECTSDNYDRAIAWCHEIITSGQQHSMALFSLPSFHSELSSASQKFNMPFESLHSLFRNVHVSYMKRSSHTLRSSTMRHVKSYLNGCSIVDLAKKANCPPTLMARLIVENVIATTTINAANTSPNTTATTNNTNSSSNLNAGIDATYKKKLVSEALRHPERSLGCASTSILPEYLFSENAGKGGKRKKNEDKRDIHNDEVEEPRIPLSRLSLEVREAVDSDPMYGPRHDKERHNIGIEYELLLEETLCSMDIPFETEADLRARGTAKTPDILLSCPVGVRVRKRNEFLSPSSMKSLPMATMNEIVIDATNPATPQPMSKTTAAAAEHDNDDDNDDDLYEWKIICWIDSKALFGDVDTHNNSVLPQVETYVHRFGPGLVLYWFGHAPLSRLGDGRGDVVIVGGDLPGVFLLPTGELYGRGGIQSRTTAASKTLQF